MDNLFWPMYQMLENSFVSSCEYIYFDDKQLSVYSNKLIDILIRTWVEIESLSKSLYFSNGGQRPKNDSDLYFDTDCLDSLDRKWNLSQKMIIVSNINMHFSQNEMTLYPLKNANKRGTSGCKSKRAYEAIKHDRYESYALGNVKNCLLGLGALYLINIYYKNNDYILGDEKGVESFDPSLGSKVFSVKTAKCTDFTGEVSDPEAAYYISYTKKFTIEWEERNKVLNSELMDQITKDPDILAATLSALNSGAGAKSVIQNAFSIVKRENMDKYLKSAATKAGFEVLISRQSFHAYPNHDPKI